MRYQRRVPWGRGPERARPGAGLYGDLAYSLRAQHLMRTTAPVVSTETTVEEALNLMATHQVEYVPVIQGSVLRGMLTSAAIARAESSAVISELTEHSQNIEAPQHVEAGQNTGTL